MKYFKRIADGIDTGPFLAEIAANYELWFADTSRQEKIITQRETQAIIFSSLARAMRNLDAHLVPGD